MPTMVPLVFLFSWIPHSYSPTEGSSLYSSAYSKNGATVGCISFVHHRGLGISVETEHLGQFNKFSLGLNANKSLNEELFVSSGIQLEQLRNSSSAVYSMQSNSRILWQKGPTQSSMFLTVGGKDRLNYSLQHLYRIDSFLSLIAGWEGSRAQLFYGLHFEVKGMLCTFIQHERISELKLALQHKNFWLQVTFKTGMLHSPTQFLCRL